jgi:hypothetical protein
MANEIIVAGINNPALIAKDLKTQVNVIQDVMKSVMVNGEHYGTIPGCGDKKVLLKSGAEKLLLAFRLGAEPAIETNETGDSVSYRVRVRLFTIMDNNTVGYGIGECSSLEEKYLWRKAIGAEYKNTPEDRRRIKYGNKGDIEQVKTNHHDTRNTVLKMAKKRALVDAVLTATAASDIFTQDLEEWDEAMIETLADNNATRHKAAAVKPAPSSISVVTPNMPAPKSAANNAPDSKPVAPSAPANQPKAPVAKSDASIETLSQAVKQLGLEPEIQGSFIAARGANAYQKRDALKRLGFAFKPDTKVWYCKAAA